MAMFLAILFYLAFSLANFCQFFFVHFFANLLAMFHFIANKLQAKKKIKYCQLKKNLAKKRDHYTPSAKKIGNILLINEQKKLAIGDFYRLKTLAISDQGLKFEI
jgi:hypothetical protein